MIDFGYGVKLGPLRSENCWRYFDDRNDPSIWKWCRQYDLLCEGAHGKWLKDRLDNVDPKIKMYEILAVDYVGVCGLTDIDLINSRAEFSLYVVPKFQRKGIARKALKTLLAHGFYNLGLNTIWGETFEENPALELFLDMEMTHEGVRDSFYYRDGRFIDCHLVSMCRPVFDDVSKKWLKALH